MSSGSSTPLVAMVEGAKPSRKGSAAVFAGLRVSPARVGATVVTGGVSARCRVSGLAVPRPFGFATVGLAIHGASPVTPVSPS